jgi:hypothetical protein
VIRDMAGVVLDDGVLDLKASPAMAPRSAQSQPGGDRPLGGAPAPTLPLLPVRSPPATGSIGSSLPANPAIRSPPPDRRLCAPIQRTGPSSGEAPGPREPSGGALLSTGPADQRCGLPSDMYGFGALRSASTGCRRVRGLTEIVSTFCAALDGKVSPRGACARVSVPKSIDARLVPRGPGLAPKVHLQQEADKHMMPRGCNARGGVVLVKVMMAVAIIGLLWAIVLPAVRLP